MLMSSVSRLRFTTHRCTEALAGPALTREVDFMLRSRARVHVSNLDENNMERDMARESVGTAA
jgi:hypothetical protein